MARYPGPLLWNVGFIIATVSAIGVLLGTFAFVGSVAFGVGCIASARLLRRKQYENAVMATVIGSASSSVITGILQAVTGDYVLGAGSLLLGAFFAQYVVNRAWTGNVGHRLRQLNTRLSQSQ